MSDRPSKHSWKPAAGQQPSPQPAFPRRDFLRQAVALGAVALGPVESLADDEQAAEAPTPTPAPFSGYEYFSPQEAAFVEALVNIMCPADAYTPNGVDCGLATFFDRQLAGPFGQGRGRYLRGPWNAGPPQMGLQSPLTPAQFFSEGLRVANALSLSRHGKSFDQLDAARAEAMLHEFEAGGVAAPALNDSPAAPTSTVAAGSLDAQSPAASPAAPHSPALPIAPDSAVSLADWFNALVYPLFVQACFADPLYGGNHDKVFWKMIGYPGLPATHALDMVQYRGKPYPGASNPKSIVDFS